jgi:acyl-CoA synthetase (AMP-forming)/AMP-acid ligase II
MLKMFASHKLGGIEDIGLSLSWDAAKLRHEIIKRATALTELGVEPGSLVAICHGGTAHFFADLLAIWYVGASAACLDATLTSSELQNIVAFAKPCLVLVDGRPMAADLPVPIVDLADRRRGSTPVREKAVDPEKPALLLFTSGTTGTPKSVVLSFRALHERINANIAAIGISTLMRTLVTLPTHFGHGLHYGQRWQPGQAPKSSIVLAPPKLPTGWPARPRAKTASRMVWLEECGEEAPQSWPPTAS